jgi:hypothetical protein
MLHCNIIYILLRAFGIALKKFIKIFRVLNTRVATTAELMGCCCNGKLSKFFGAVARSNVISD